MICACPCRKEFEPRRPNQKYRTSECKERARRERSAPMWLTTEERRRVERARRSRKGVEHPSLHPFPNYVAAGLQRAQQEPLSDCLMTSEQVRKFLGVSKWQMREWRTSPIGGGPAFIRIGKRARYLPSDVLRFVQSRRKAGATRPQRHRTTARN